MHVIGVSGVVIAHLLYASYGRRTQFTPSSITRSEKNLQETVAHSAEKSDGEASKQLASLLLASTAAAGFQVNAGGRSGSSAITKPPAARMQVTDSPPKVAATIRPDLASAIGNEPTKGMADEEAMLAKSTFPIPPEELIGLAKAFTAAQLDGTADGSGGNPDWFAEDFRFVAPVVGPFDKDLFLDSLKSLDMRTAFPDVSANYHHFRVCPFEPNRVWYSIKYTGTNTGPVMGRPATGKYIESPVQSHSITFNEKGEVQKFTIGYVMDKETGNTGGLGGVFGLFYAIGYGLPFPEAQPYSPSPIYGTLMSVNRGIQDLFKEFPAFKSATQSVLTTLGGGKD